jgi:hypothetical protein
MEIKKYLNLIQGQSNLINRLTEENNALRELLVEQKYRTELYIGSTHKYRDKYDGLLKQLKEIK